MKLLPDLKSLEHEYNLYLCLYVSNEYTLHHFCQTDLSLSYRTFSLKIDKSSTFFLNHSSMAMIMKKVLII